LLFSRCLPAGLTDFREASTDPASAIRAAEGDVRKDGGSVRRMCPGMDERSRRIAQRFELPLIVAALLVIPVIVIEESPVGEPWDSIAAVLNWLIWLAFLAEAVTMLAVVPDRWRWMREHPIEVVVVVATPPFLPASLQSIRVLRLLRLLRLFPLLRYGRRLFSAEGLRYAALLTLLVAIGGGTAYAALEDKPTAWDGIWWAVTTMTTVGYGDQFPTTAEGRVLAMAVMLVGIGFLTMLIGAAAERFVARDLQQDVDEIERELSAADEDVLRELRALRGQLDALEAAVRSRH
jgi:voltage-gated potassium channel